MLFNSIRIDCVVDEIVLSNCKSIVFEIPTFVTQTMCTHHTCTAVVCSLKMAHDAIIVAQ